MNTILRELLSHSTKNCEIEEHIVTTLSQSTNKIDKGIKLGFLLVTRLEIYYFDEWIVN